MFLSPKPIWEALTSSVLSGRVPMRLPGPWQLMLLGDGSPTRHLNLLTGEEVKIELIGMEAEPNLKNNAPLEVLELNPPLIKRQVWLLCGTKTLAWAESWWNKAEADHHLKNKNEPIWQSLSKGRSELFREVDGLALVEAPWLEKRFQTNGPFWSRHYRFFRHKTELTVIREVFSPELELWLGDSLRQQLRETNES